MVLLIRLSFEASKSSLTKELLTIFKKCKSVRDVPVTWYANLGNLEDFNHVINFKHIPFVVNAWVELESSRKLFLARRTLLWSIIWKNRPFKRYFSFLSVFGIKIFRWYWHLNSTSWICRVELMMLIAQFLDGAVI